MSMWTKQSIVFTTLLLRLLGVRNTEVIVYAIGTLTERQLKVIALRYQEGKTLGEVGDILEVTDKRIHQIEQEALEKMRDYINNDRKV